MLKILFSRIYRDDIEKYNVVENPPLAFDIHDGSTVKTNKEFTYKGYKYTS